MNKDLIEKQIQLEKQMTETASAAFKVEFERNCLDGNFGSTGAGVKIIYALAHDLEAKIQAFINDYNEGKPVRQADTINFILQQDAFVTAYLTLRTVMNALYIQMPVISLYQHIGQNLEDEYKMQAMHSENKFYYDTIKKDLNSRGAKFNRKKYITQHMFEKKYSFHVQKWSKTDKVRVGQVLLNMLLETTDCVYLETFYKGSKAYKVLVPTEELTQVILDTNSKLSVLNPFYLPMVCKPKKWTDPFTGGYLSPYVQKCRLVKNNSKQYQKDLINQDMPLVYEAINHLQNTGWQINKDVLNVISELLMNTQPLFERAGMPKMADAPLPPFPFPEKSVLTPEEKQIVKQWKLITYETHKQNVAERSRRLLTLKILDIANQFKDYETIYFPYQMDFRGRLYPIPALLQPQGCDLAKALLRFSHGKKLSDNGLFWLKVHGSNVYGYDKVSYKERVQFINEKTNEIKQIADDPINNTNWISADKPLQYLAFCLEYSNYLANPNTFVTHLPIQMDGTCNGLQHYSAMLKDEKQGKSVNLIPDVKPADIYTDVAETLKTHLEKLNEPIGLKWLELGITRKLTKRPVMVLPYGGSIISTRQYIEQFLTENFSKEYVFDFFKTGKNPNDCIFKVSNYLSKHLWQAIQETIPAASIGMTYIKTIAKKAVEKNKPLRWVTPVNFLVEQNYKERKSKIVKTEIAGTLLKTKINIDTDKPDKTRQLNGICPNFVHSLDSAVLISYLVKCKKAGIYNFMTVHDSYGTYACDTDMSHKLLRDAFVEVYKMPILDDFTYDIFEYAGLDEPYPESPVLGNLNIEDVKNSPYFFN